MKKSTMKILMAALSLIMALGIATGSTFAWFSLNNRVTVTGMDVTTKVGNSVQIAPSSLSATTKAADNTFVNGINQAVSGLLEPVSTTDGEAFWYTSTANVGANGDALAESYIDYATTGKSAATDSTTYADKFSENYVVSKTTASDASGKNYAEGYVDYVFQIKATNTTGSNVELRMTKLNLLYNLAAPAGNEIKAFRVAIFAEKFSSAFTDGVGDLITILTPYTNGEAAGNYQTSGQAVKTASTLAAIESEIEDEAVIGEVTANETEWFKVVVRMWIEGEDKTCTNETFMPLDKHWALDLAIELGSGDAVDKIGSSANLTVSGAGTATATLTIADATLNAATTVKTYQWYKVGSPDAAVDGASNASALTNAFTATESGSYYCIVTAYGSQYKSPVVALTVS